MSTYSTTVGRIEFSEEDKYKNVVKKLQKSNWPVDIHNPNCEIDAQQIGDEITYGVETINEKQKYIILIPKNKYRNIIYYSNELTEHADSWVLISGITDGVQLGRINTNKNTKEIDLRKWGGKNKTMKRKLNIDYEQINSKRVNELAYKFVYLKAETYGVEELCQQTRGEVPWYPSCHW